MPSTDGRSPDSAYIIGIAATAVGRLVDQSFTDLARLAFTGALEDARLDDPERIEATWFSNTLMDFWDQRALRGQAVLGPLMEEGVFPDGQRIINVECGCATGTVAFSGALDAVRNGADLTLAIGVEKMNDAERPGGDMLAWMEGSGNVLDPDWFWAPYRKLAGELGTSFELAPGRSLAMDAYSILALWHMDRYGTTVEQLAHVAAKNHTNAVGNPRAQYRFPMTVEEVLADREVVKPLTRAMCAPRGDAGAAVLVCSARFLAEQPAEVRERALLIRGHDISGGNVSPDWEDARAPVRSARASYAQAGLGPEDLDLVELHDASAFAEIAVIEDIGLCPRGEGGAYTESGATARDGEIPVNPSGGLISRGHPIGATGIVMLNELALQLRGEAGEIQVPGARIAMAENGGGMLRLDNAVCATTILERTA